MHRIVNVLRSERGQTTAEYALVLLVVGVVVGVFIAIVKGGGLGGFFESILGRLSDGIDI